MSFYVEKKPRRDRSGTEYFGVTYMDADGKRKRVAQATCVRHCRTYGEAVEWANSQAAVRSSQAEQHKRRLAWRSQYHDFEALVDLYQTWQQRQAPNSWEGNLHYLKQWVLPYFLTEHHAGNANDWHLLFQEYRDWLRRPDAMSRRNKSSPIAVSTANNIIKTLNTFLTCLSRYNKIDPANARPCDTFPEHETNRRGAGDVIPADERDLVAAVMRRTSEPAAEFFLVLWHTGMRFSELFGLPMTALFRGQITGPIHDELIKCGVNYVGYLYLDSQPAFDDRRREADGSVKRKPLKGRKTIGAKDARLIPIRSKEIWNILAARFKAQSELVLKGTYTADRANYMLFEDLEWNVSVNSLRNAYAALKRTPKQYHCCRHTFTTTLVGETRSFFLVRAITGHRKDASFERYLHIYEQMALEAKQKVQEIDLIS
jgi:integrase